MVAVLSVDLGGSWQGQGSIAKLAMRSRHLVGLFLSVVALSSVLQAARAFLQDAKSVTEDQHQII
ncbi:hypothetical protein N7517_000865 [Penicillium concentricum]|uniref:Uncharacterized protein n=1 Tax=Penicillium concentricum TaxID=293559 RepID=A0A9W9SSZ0_9EURO|nr:uncharacterized protein N7517_000865 [Penicillium concentricum]KAJ5382954.1 hypothetical protein N7517_000865 [Penicillium concentricum]